ncbi:MAG: zinc-ribbon domain-containing protein [Lachnospiraceae bacterium]|nr:zinc-ribbon domain-containing protein [Lachnospiraceae bacterium]
MFCQACGSRNRDDAVFCENCGTRLDKGEPEMPVQAQTPPVYGAQMQPMPAPPVPPASAPIETVYVKPVKPVEKWVILFIAEVAVAALALIFLFHNAAKLFEASKIGERYFVAAANGDWREAYRMLEVEESDFINADAFETVNQTNRFPMVNTYSVNEQKELDLGALGTTVQITYRGLGDSYDSAYNVVLNRQPKKQFLFFDNWKVSADQIIMSDCTVQVPKGAAASVDGVELTAQSAGLSQSEEGYDIYTIPALFQGEHSVTVSMEGMETVEDSFDTGYNNGYRLYEMQVSEETAREVIAAGGSNLQEIYAAALGGSTYATIQNLFTSNEESGIEEDYQNLLEAMQNDDYYRIESIAFSEISGTSYSYTDDGVMVIEVSIPFTYQLDYTYEDWDEKQQQETYSSTDSVTFYFIQENGSWVLNNLGCHELYF